MESLILSLNVVMPLLFLILVGQGVRRRHLCDERTLKQMNQWVFKLFLPCTLFNNILATDLKTVLQPQMLIAVIVPLFNILSVIVLESFRGGKARLSKLAEGIVTNPLILASGLGLLCLFTGIHLWKPLASVISDMGKVSTPLALIILGAGFQAEKVAENKKELIASVSARLVWTPLAALGTAVVLGIRGVALVSLLAIFASPNAVSSYSMAEGMGSDSELASQGLLFSTVFCIPTIFLWIFCFSQFGFI